MRRDEIEFLVHHPSESLNLEIKTWIDPSSEKGISKLVRSLLALRNRNGGHLIIGLNNKTLNPDQYPYRIAVTSHYSVDTVQALVSKFAQDPFDISIQYRNRNGIDIPVIIVPNGIKVPVVVKRGLQVDGNKLLENGDIYFRTLRANGTPSSARIKPGDFEELLEICFENRESDIGRFLRRQLSKPDRHGLYKMLADEDFNSKLTGKDSACQVVEVGTKSMKAAITNQERQSEWKSVQDRLTMKVGLAIFPQFADSTPTREFMNKVATGNPNYTGWPMWLDSRNFSEQRHRAYVQGQQWEALIVDLCNSQFKHFDFYQFNPKGEFYLFRVMDDDLQANVSAGTSLDVTLMIRRVAEVLAVGINLGRSLGWQSDSIASFVFEWSGLNKRRLVPWVRPMEWLGAFAGTSYSNRALSDVSLRIDTPHSALAPYISKAIARLFSQFDGYEAPNEMVERCLNGLLKRD